MESDPTTLSPHLPAPPEETYSTYEELEYAVQDFARVHGYAVAIARSNRDRKGILKTRTLNCVKSGRVRDRVADRKKPLVSQKTQCPFTCHAELKEGTGWVLTIRNPLHNHEAENPLAFHQHRKLPSIIRFQIAAMSRAGITPKEIASTLSQSHPDCLWRMQDIYNLRQELKAELLNGRSLIEAMLHQLHTSQYEYNYSLDTDGRISMLLFVHPDSLQLLRQYPEVLLMDCTYKTNRFRMPLLDILGSTGLGKTFYAAFVFLSGETEIDYYEALKMFHNILHRKSIQQPGVIVTDCDTGLMKAIESVFPNAANILCLWHINKNVLGHAQRHQVYQPDTDTEEAFLKTWNRLVSATSPEDYGQQLSALKNAYRRFPDFLRYLDKTWLTNHKKRFVRCWTDRYLHFGHRETSRAEGAHSVIKRYLQVSTGDLNHVLTSLALMLSNQHSEHLAAFASSKNRTPQCFLIPLLQSLIGHITPYALWRVYHQLEIVNRLSLHHPCHRTHLDSMGLPCYHVIQERKTRNEVLYLHDFHRRWFFVSPPEDFIQIPPQPILNPSIIRTRGRPQNQPQSSTRRNLSQFEKPNEKRKNSQKLKGRKRTRTGQQRNRHIKTPEPESSGQDSSEDALVEVELERLKESRGTALPLWAEMEEFAGMTRATQVPTTRRSKRLVEQGNV